jgi:lysophospholipase L1-like esterase
VISLGLGLGLTRGGAPAWSPAKLGGLLFLGDPNKSSTLTLVSSTHVSVWADAAGGSVVLTQSTDSQRPTLDTSVTLGGRPTLKADKTAHQQILSASGGVTGNAAHTTLAIMRCDTISSYSHPIAMGGVGASSGIGTTDAAGTVWWAGGAGLITPVGGLPNASNGANAPAYGTVNADTTTFHVFCKVHGSDGKDRLYVDGYLVAGPTSNTYNLTPGMGLFPHAANAEGSAHIAHLAFCSGALPVGDRHSYEAWARSTFGSSFGIAAALPSQLVCLGDSLTHGTGATTGTSDYPTQLAALLGTSPTLWNLGVPGQTVATALTTAEADVAGHTTGLAPSTKIVIWYGTNDGIQHYTTDTDASVAYGNLTSYVSSVKSYAPPGTKVVVCTLHHAGSGYSGVASVTAYNAWVDLYNARIRAGAAANGYTVCDLGADSRIDLQVHPERSADGLHGDATFYGYVAADVQAVL